MSMHARHWTPAQDQALAALAGTRPVAEIADAIWARFWLRRTETSLRVRAKRLGVSLWSGGYSLRDLVAVFGVDHRVIRQRWIAPGHLAGRRHVGRGPNAGWWFEPAEVERFIRDCGWLIDLARMRLGHRLTRLAETAQKADPWIVGYPRLAKLLGGAVVNVHRWVARGLVPHQRRPCGGSGGTICVRGRDVPAIRSAIAAAQANARLTARARFGAHRQRQAARALAVTQRQADRLRGVCRNGHARTVTTTRVTDGGRLVCRTCRANRIALGRAG